MNSIGHSDGDRGSLEITVSTEERGESVAIEVRDDGPGIPASELTVSETGRETPLDHGSGIGP